MSQGVSCKCDPKLTTAGKVTFWRVVQRNCNHSRFNGSRKTWSDYSEIHCLKCRRFWRSKAEYVSALRDVTKDELGIKTP